MEDRPRVSIREAVFPSDLASIKHLFTLYAASLKIDLTFQDFTNELASLPGKYASPTGTILLAVPTPTLLSPSPDAIGVVALRPLPAPESQRICEMKRLYCTPESRGLGVGKALVEEIMSAAVKLGYTEVRLDTLPSMAGARALYERWGFVPIEPYYDTPLEGTIFLGRKL